MRSSAPFAVQTPAPPKEVRAYKGDEISHKAEGGATCLTRPILRG